MNAVELVADLQGVPATTGIELAKRWAADDPTGLLIRRATFAVSADLPDATIELPERWSVVSAPQPGFWDAVLHGAGEGGRAALVLLDAVLPSMDAVGLLMRVLEEDPMFGAAAARVQCEGGCCTETLPIPGNGPGTFVPEWLPRRALQHLPEREMPGDILLPCLVVRPVILADFSTNEQPFRSLTGTIAHRLAAGRRCGFRTVVANRALVRLSGLSCAEPPAAPPAVPADEAERLRAFVDYDGDGYVETRGASTALHERLLARQLAVAERRVRASLLLDMRNVRATYNGTAFAALGVARGLHQTGMDWDVAILAHPDGSAFHQFESIFPEWTVHTRVPPAGFTAALRLSQPWRVQEMIDLHKVARLNAYLMLDTIAWDVLYVAPPHLDATWDFLASAADGLLFISEFSRARFRNRFPDSHPALEGVCHLSFDPRDYTRPECLEAATGDHLLVIGNHLDHKDVAATVDLLASAFPFLPIESLGGVSCRSPRVTVHTSGNLADADAHRLYARARIAVFPSFYEGFGFPIVTALAYGRTLLTRASALVDEIAPYCPPQGRLITYSQRTELVECVGRVLHGEVVRHQPTGDGLNGGAPRSWRMVGSDVLRFLETLTSRARPDEWWRRDRHVRHLLAYDPIGESSR